MSVTDVGKFSGRRRINTVALLCTLGVSLLLVLLLGRAAQFKLAPEAELGSTPGTAGDDENRTAHLRGDVAIVAVVWSRRHDSATASWSIRLLPDPVDDAIIARLADAIGDTPDKVGANYPAAEENMCRVADLDTESVASTVPHRRRVPRQADRYGLPPAEPGTRHRGRIVRSKLRSRRGAARTEAEPDGSIVVSDGTPDPTSTSTRKKGLIRYLPLGPVLMKTVRTRLAVLRVTHKRESGSDPGAVMVERRAVREYPGGPDSASLAGKVDWAGGRVWWASNHV